MAQLKTYKTEDLRTSEGEFPNAEPGEYVHHLHDRKSFGTVVARVGDECSVLWSREPKNVIDVDIQPIQSTTRKLRAQWSAEEALPEYGTGLRTISRLPVFKVEEEYESLSYEEVQRLHGEGADIQLHSDGRVTVKRETHEPPPPELRGAIHKRVIRF